MTDVELKKLVDSTIDWANKLSDVWVGTTTGNIIRSQRDHLEYLVDCGDMNLVSVQVLELAQTCDQVEKESDGH